MNKYIFISMAIISCLSGCQSIYHGSTEKRAQRLSQGIQSAYNVQSTTADQIAPLIIQNAERHQVSPSVLAAVIRQESHYRIGATSPAGAVGLTQVIPRYWQKKCPGDLYQADINVNCGALILQHYEQLAGSQKKALAYYNVGPSAYEKNRKMRKQGKKYAKQVKKHEKQLKSKI